MINPFATLSQEQKVDFFVKCQELMMKYHPTSPLIVREDALEKVLDVFYNNIQKYQGYYYMDDNICVLWNHILINEPNDAKRALVENAYKQPNPQFNAVSIDFAVFRKMSDCLDFIKSNNNNLIKYVLFVRGGNPKIYPIEQILKGIGF